MSKKRIEGASSLIDYIRPKSFNQANRAKGLSDNLKPTQPDADSRFTYSPRRKKRPTQLVTGTPSLMFSPTVGNWYGQFKVVELLPEGITVSLCVCGEVTRITAARLSKAPKCKHPNGVAIKCNDRNVRLFTRWDKLIKAAMYNPELICSSWRAYPVFENQVAAGEIAKGHLVRLDPRKPYSKANSVWLTAALKSIPDMWGYTVYTMANGDTSTLLQLAVDREASLSAVHEYNKRKSNKPHLQEYINTIGL